jgi:integrase
MASQPDWPTLPVEEWPCRDREAWEAACRPGGPLDRGGSAAGLGVETRRTVQQLYGQLLHWLRERGELDPEAGPAERLTHARFVFFVTERRASVSANTLFNHLRMLAMMLGALAPGSEWGWIYRHPSAPRRHEAAASRRPVAPVQPGLLLGRLLTAIHEVLKEPVTTDSVIRLRNLLIVAVTTTTALRRRNILALTIGESILRHKHGYEVRFPANAVKNSRAISMMLMPELTACIDQYVEVYRMHLLTGRGNAGSALWISNEGGRLAATSFAAAFRQVTTQFLGYRVNPHALRHGAATAILGTQSLQTDLASAVLAHKDPTTVDRFYDLSGNEAAQALWRDLLRKFRKRRGTRRG